MKKILIVTRNEGKIREIMAILRGLPVEFTLEKDFPDFPEIEEDGYTYTENALKKAAIACIHTELPAVAEDSGLEVYALNGMPGIYSARYAGIGATDEQRIAKLLEEMKGIPRENRKARYVCSAAFALPDGERYIKEGTVEGEILEEPRGTAGFGYDPVFYIPEYNSTMAELPMEIKNSISHRGKALNKLKEDIARWLARS